MIFATLLFL